MALAFGTAAAFVIMQSAFWLKIGSTQLETVIKDKSKLVDFYLQLSVPRARVEFCNKLVTSFSTTDEERAQMDARNYVLLKGAVTPYLLTFGIASLTFLLIAAWRIAGLEDREQAMQQTIAILVGFAFVLLSFSTEIFVFYYVIRPSVLVGDVEMFALKWMSINPDFADRVRATEEGRKA
ncbi:MAG: hypothetical protein ACO32I_07605 [Candidatus Limnocylindrus sp.]